MRKLSLLAVVLMLALVCAGAAYASSVPEPFPTAGDAYCSFTNGCGNIPPGGQTAFMWTTGDYVQSPIFITGQPFVNSLQYNILYDNVIGGGNSETVDILINNIVVGDFVAPDCNYCGQTYTASGVLNFSNIAPVGGGYQLELMLTNTLPPGGGSIAFEDGGMVTLSGGGQGTTPEPGSILLFGSGIVGIAGLLRRKMQL